MNDKKGLSTTATVVWVVVALVVIGGLLWWWSSRNYPSSNENPSYQTPPPAANAPANGTVYLSFSDAAVNMNSISAVNMTVDKAYLHSQTQGWVTVSETPQTFNLLALKAKGKEALFGNVQVQEDTYDQVWFHVSSIKVTESSKVKEATMPSADFKMDGTVKVVGNENSEVNLDVLVSQSLHKTDQGEFVFTPVVNLTSHSNATVSVDSNNLVTVSDGNSDSDVKAGMDVDGTVKSNFQLDLNTNLEIKSGAINIK